jgi:hypothetical protein
MRVVKQQQSCFGQVAIADIQFNARSRDDVPAVLKGLQYIYVTEAVREKVFALLENSLSHKVKHDTGRPGMEQWQIFVLASLKLATNCDFDRLQEFANSHLELRQMLGLSGWEDPKKFAMQTLIDNVTLLDPKVLADINQVVVESGHELLKKKLSEPLLARCDSFVVETDVHYPTDTNLLWDAMRCLIILVGRASEKHGIAGWRQHQFNADQLRGKLRAVQNIRRSHSQDESKKKRALARVHQCVRDYLSAAQQHVDKSKQTREALLQHGDVITVVQMDRLIAHAERQMNQIERRLLKGETIPHVEKVFSIFEEHTEWISKGKAGVPVELGVRVCVLEDQYQFVLHHRIMWKETDDKVAVAMIEDTQKRYPALSQCSFDKGFYTPANREQLDQLLKTNVLPKKGRLNVVDQARETSEEFTAARRQHSAVESCINNLEVRGLDRCLSYGRDGFERHVALSVVACNLHRIGLVLQRNERERLMKEKRRHEKQKLAA